MNVIRAEREWRSALNGKNGKDMQHICKQASEQDQIEKEMFGATSRLFGASFTMTSNMDFEANTASQSECGMCINGPRTCCPFTERLAPLQCWMHKLQSRRCLIRRFSRIILRCTLMTEAKTIRVRVPHRIQMCPGKQSNASMRRNNRSMAKSCLLLPVFASQYVTSRGCAPCSCSIFTSTWPDRFHYWRFPSHLCAAVKSSQIFNAASAQMCWSH